MHLDLPPCEFALELSACEHLMSGKIQDHPMTHANDTFESKVDQVELSFIWI